MALLLKILSFIEFYFIISHKFHLTPLLKTRDWGAISKAIRTKRGALLVLYRYFPIFVTNQNTKDNEKY